MTEHDEPLTPPVVPEPPPAPPASETVPPDETPAETPDQTPDEKTPDEPKREGPSFMERLGTPVAKLRTVSGAPVVALAAATLVLLITTVLLALMVFAPAVAPFRLGSARAGSLAQRDVAIEKIAVRFAHNLLTFDYRTVDADLSRLQRDSTGNFVKQLKEVRGSKPVLDALKAQQASSTGQVRGAVVESVHGDTATVRVFLARTVRNKGLKEPRTTLENVELTLVKTSKGWKVDNVG